MKKSTLIGSCLLFLATIFVSCVQDAEPPKEPLNLDPYHISVERAIATMNTAIAELYSGTRTPRDYTIETLKGSDLRKSGTTRSEISDTLPPLPKEVLYIVNFANDEGFAVLAADNRLDPVLAITEKGKLTLSDFEEAMSFDTTSVTPPPPPVVIGGMIRDYLLRPNFGNEYALDENGNPITPTNPPVDPSDPLITEKVYPLLGTMRWNQCLPFNGMAIHHGAGAGYGYGGNSAAGCIAVAVGQIMAYHGVPALKAINSIDLSAYGIDGPISEYKDIHNSKRVANPELGDANILCDTITLSDLELNRIELMYSDIPDTLKTKLLSKDSIAITTGIEPSYYITKTITWGDIKRHNYNTSTAYDFVGDSLKIGGERIPNRYDELMRRNIAYFMRWIGWGVNMVYNYWGGSSSFAYPTDARDFFRERGYSSLDRPSWDVERRNVVVSHLKAGNPVMMSALSICSPGGHAWVFDGYYKKNGSYYFHCNWGWGGNGNGYYLSGVFDTRERVGIEEGVDSGEETTGDDNNFNLMSRSVTAVPK